MARSGAERSDPAWYEEAPHGRLRQGKTRYGTKMKRGIRLHHKRRLKKKRKNYWSLKGTQKGYEHPCRCSCAMCGNMRRFGDSKKEKLTIQERRHANTAR